MPRRTRPASTADPGDLTWTPVVQGGESVAGHWIRANNLKLFVRSQVGHDGFTVAHH